MPVELLVTSAEALGGTESLGELETETDAEAVTDPTAVVERDGSADDVVDT